MKNDKKYDPECGMPCSGYKALIKDRQILNGLLIKCRDKFSEYVKHHEARGSIDKAKSNQEYVNMINIVLEDK